MCDLTAVWDRDGTYKLTLVVSRIGMPLTRESRVRGIGTAVIDEQECIEIGPHTPASDMGLAGGEGHDNHGH